VSAVLAGLGRAGRAWRLALVLLAANALSAAILAVPLAATLEAEFAHRGSGPNMMYGFDYPWWSEWTDTRAGWARSFGPDLLGAGFAWKNVDLLRRGEIPLRAFHRADEGFTPPGPLLTGVGGAYLLLHVFLSGGAVSMLRQPRPTFALRAFLHACGFYFGRFLRITLLALAAAAALFAAWWPVAGWMEGRAREAVDERAATAWLLARVALPLLALALLHVAATYARIVTVAEDRRSAALAWLSALSLVARTAAHALALVLVVAALAGLAVAAFATFEGVFHPTGYRTQLVAFAAMQALMFGRVLLRLALWGGLFALYERTAPAPAE
jgi:hypothetical protein